MCLCIDRSLSSERRHVFHSVALTFDNARMECVSNNGDLPSIENDADLNNVISNITVTPASAAANSSNTGSHSHTPSFALFLLFLD